MIKRRDFRDLLALVLAISLACPPAQALVTLNDSHDHIYVTGNLGYAWDSNVYANAEARGDYTMNASVVTEYTRRAGWIGVNGRVQVDASRYNKYTTENFNNPKFGLELTKQTGRTTGSLTLNAARQSRADAAVNLRTESWNYTSGLNFRYPIVGIYTLSGGLGYTLTKYVGTSAFPDLATYSANVDLFRILSSERDLILGYRYRLVETSANSSYDDHGANIGLSGKLIRGLNGSLRAGYVVRLPHGVTASGTKESRFSSWTASGAATYALSKRLNLTGSLSKDISTTASDASVDTTSVTVDATFAFSSRWTFSATAGFGDSRFLGNAGRTVISLGPPLIYGPSRHDDYANASASVNYTLNQHLRVSGSYAWFKNWSTLSYADFVRESCNLGLSSRW